MDPYNPAHWHEFFTMMGHGSAVLAGLVFVAIELNHKALFKDATHHARALGTISGFMAAFAVSCFGLMSGMSTTVFGLLWAAAASVALAVYVSGIYKNSGSTFQSNIGVTWPRMAIGISLYVLQIAGALMITADIPTGIYIAAIALTLNMLYLVSGAWLLFIGVALLGKKGKV